MDFYIEGLLPESEKDTEGLVYYFAYGCDLKYENLKKKDIQSQKPARAALIKDWQLTFDVRSFPFKDQALPNIQHIIGTVVQGVIYSITIEDFWKLQSEELGGGVTEGYYPIKLQALLMDESNVKPQNVWVLKAHDGCIFDPEEELFLPSKQKIMQITEGALQHKLDSQYINYLQTLQNRNPNWMENLLSYLLQIISPIWHIFINIIYYFLDTKNKNQLRILYFETYYLIQQITWIIHNILSRIMGQYYIKQFNVGRLQKFTNQIKGERINSHQDNQQSEVLILLENRDTNSTWKIIFWKLFGIISQILDLMVNTVYVIMEKTSMNYLKNKLSQTYSYATEDIYKRFINLISQLFTNQKPQIQQSILEKSRNEQNKSQIDQGALQQNKQQSEFLVS